MVHPQTEIEHLEPGDWGTLVILVLEPLSRRLRGYLKRKAISTLRFLIEEI